MGFRIKSGTRLVAAQDDQPGRLDSGGMLFALDPAEERIVGILIEGASNEELSFLASQPSVSWDEATLGRFLERALEAGLLEPDNDGDEIEDYVDDGETQVMLSVDLPTSADSVEATPRAVPFHEDDEDDEDDETDDDPTDARDDLGARTHRLTKVERSGRVNSREMSAIGKPADEVIISPTGHRTIPMPRIDADGGQRSWRVVIGVILVIAVVNAGLVLHLIEVPHQRRLSCQLVPVPLARALSPIDGKIADCRVAAGQRLRKGDLVAVVTDARRSDRRAGIQTRLARDRKVLDDMSRPCGRGRKAKLAKEVRIRTLQRARFIRRCPRGPRCQERLETLDRDLVRARAGRSICTDGKASPPGKAAARRIAQAGAELDALGRRPTRSEIRSPESGVACEILPHGRNISWGSPVATVCSSSRITIAARHDGAAPPLATPAQIRLTRAGVTRTLSGVTTASTAGEIHVKATDERAATLGRGRPRCTMELALGVTPLWRTLWERL